VQRPVNADEWIFSETNRPFAPECMMNAKELSNRELSELSKSQAKTYQNSDNNGMLKVPMPT
jgi:hypothetical protein